MKIKQLHPLKPRYLITCICAIALLSGCNPSAPSTPPLHTIDSLQAQGAADSAAQGDAAPSPKEGFEAQFVMADLFKNENSDVVNTIVDEDFALAVKKSQHYLEDPQGKLTETQKANLRYMHIYALAGLVAAGKKTHSDIDQVLAGYRGQALVVQRLTVTEGISMPFNQIRVEQEQAHAIEVTCANDEGFNIHCFVRTAMKADVDLKKHVGQQAYLCGTLVEYKVSDNSVVSWITDFKLEGGFLKFLEDEFEVGH